MSAKSFLIAALAVVAGNYMTGVAKKYFPMV